MKEKTIKITKNAWGNYRGRITGDKLTTELGCTVWDAILWASQKLEENPSLKFHEKSEVTLDEVIQFRKSW